MLGEGVEGAVDGDGVGGVDAGDRGEAADDLRGGERFCAEATAARTAMRTGVRRRPAVRSVAAMALLVSSRVTVVILPTRLRDL